MGGETLGILLGAIVIVGCFDGYTLGVYMLLGIILGNIVGSLLGNLDGIWDGK